MLPPFEPLPLLRCPHGAPAALKNAMRGDTHLKKRLLGCQLAELDWAKTTTSETVLVTLGSSAFGVLQTALGVTDKKDKVKWDDVWGTYITLAGHTVYVASDWTMPNYLSEHMRGVDIARMSRRPAREQPDPIYRVDPGQFLKALKVTKRKWGPIAADIETGGFEPQYQPLRTLGIAHPSYGALVLAARDMDGTRLFKKKWVKRCVEALYEYAVIWHNSTFDTRWLEYKTGKLAGPNTLDTMLLHRILFELAPHSLAVACSMEWYTGGWKDGLNHGLSVRYLSDLMLYNGMDCLNTWRLYAILCQRYQAEYGYPAYPIPALIPQPGRIIHGVEPPHRFGELVRVAA
jgi:hypothetical protein